MLSVKCYHNPTAKAVFFSAYGLQLITYNLKIYGQNKRTKREDGQKNN